MDQRLSALKNPQLRWQERRVMLRLEGARVSVPIAQQNNVANDTLAELDGRLNAFRKQNACRGAALLKRVGGLSPTRLSTKVVVSNNQAVPILPASSLAQHGEATPATFDAETIRETIAILHQTIDVMKARAQPRTTIPDRVKDSRTGRLLLALPFMKRLILNLYFLATYEARAMAAENVRQTEALVSFLKRIS